MKTRKNSQAPAKRARKGTSRKKTFPQFTGKVMMTREGFIFVRVEGQDAVRRHFVTRWCADEHIAMALRGIQAPASVGIRTRCQTAGSNQMSEE